MSNIFWITSQELPFPWMEDVRNKKLPRQTFFAKVLPLLGDVTISWNFRRCNSGLIKIIHAKKLGQIFSLAGLSGSIPRRFNFYRRRQCRCTWRRRGCRRRRCLACVHQCHFLSNLCLGQTLQVGVIVQAKELAKVFSSDRLAADSLIRSTVVLARTSTWWRHSSNVATWWHHG